MVKLSLKQLGFKYRKSENYVFEDINLEFKSGDIVSIEGENATGKTTLLKVIAGILNVDNEKIKLGNYKVNSREYKKSIAYISSNPTVFDVLTGVEHLELITDLWEMKGLEKRQFNEKFFELAGMLDIKKFLNEKVENYSLGTKYKLYFVCMIARSPKLILMDEPLTSLDVRSQEKAIYIIKNICKDSIVIFTSHQAEIIKKISTKRFYISDRNLVEY